MEIKSYAKINISLDVTGKRKDGYHLLEMIMQNVEVYDVININKQNAGITIKCNLPYIPTDEKNLAYKAAKLFIDTYDIKEGVTINIIKNIPVTAGLAGGSSNAAAVLKAMKAIFGINISNSELCDLGLKIGADVPYCILGGTALCRGIGEKVIPLRSFKNHILVLVKPPFGVSTKEVYSKLDTDKIYKHPDTKAIVSAMEANDIYRVSSLMRNVLENVTLKKHYIIKDIKKQMLNLGAVGSMMSGSGPTVFAFFDDMLKAQKCYEFMKNIYKEVFITRTI